MASQQAPAGDRTTNFSLACSLLSQLVKENANKGKLEAFRVPVTMNLLQGVEENNIENKGNTLELFPHHPATVKEDKIGTPQTRLQDNSQLTIFYGGKVLVFDEFPADRAEDLMQFATKASSTAQNFSYVPPSMASKGKQHMLPQSLFPDLPLTRKASLQRFFDMRKDRIKSKAPYSVSSKASPAKSEESATWLGLVPQASKATYLNNK